MIAIARWPGAGIGGNSMSFGSTIKRLRKEKGYTQDQLANLLCVTPQAISRWENNSAVPDISMVIPIPNVTSVSADALL